MSMIEIGLSKVAKKYSFHSVLEDLTFDVMSNDRLALIGENGCGKTTLLKLISGLEDLTSGKISIRKGATLGLLSQIPDEENETVTISDILYRELSEILKKKIKLEE